jgi:dTDP-4-amino-4,6-dideoxygalactose transaminase
MQPIQMVDLKRQYHHIKKEVDDAVMQVLESTVFIGGKQVQDFSTSLASYLGAQHVIPCANGTDALQISLMALDLQPGDEVITPSFTYFATAEVVALLRLKAVFADVTPGTFCIDPASLEKCITPRTKAIIPVHLYGQSAPMAQILEIAGRHGIPVIEDNAQAIGAEYRFPDGSVKKTGTMGLIGTTSFFPSKNLGCYGDGGAIITDNAALADRLKMIANHGQKVRYYHELVGCNSRLDALQAAILNIKLKKLDEYNASRRRAAEFYNKAFAGISQITTPAVAPENNHVYHQYTLKLEGVDRDGLRQYLEEKGIPSMLYYPVPVHRQKMFDTVDLGEVDLPVTDWLTERVISLPMHSELDDEQLNFITKHVSDFVHR